MGMRGNPKFQTVSFLVEKSFWEEQKKIAAKKGLSAAQYIIESVKLNNGEVAIPDGSEFEKKLSDMQSQLSALSTQMNAIFMLLGGKLSPEDTKKSK